VGLAAHLCRLMLTGNPTLESARLCAEILEERVGGASLATRYAVELCRALQLLRSDGERFQRLDLAASVLAQLEQAPEIVSQLFAQGDSLANELALAMLSMDLVPLSVSLVEAALPALESKSVEERYRRAAIVSLVPRLQWQPQLNERALRAYVRVAPDKLARIERLQELQTDVGRSPVIGKICLELEAAMRVRCPLCHDVFSGSDMRIHAVNVHQMIWEGRRLRQPWSLAEDCLEQYGTERDAKLLEMGEQYAQLSGGENHVHAYMRTALQRGYDIPKYVAYFESHASQRHATICGNCFEFIPSPRSVSMLPVTIDERGSVVSTYITVACTRTLLHTEAEIIARDEIWTGTQPEGHLSRRGVFVVLGAFFGALFLVTSLLFLRGFGEASTLSMVWLIFAGVCGLLAALYKPRHDSALSATWEFVVPQLLKNASSSRGIAFLAGLARASESHPDRSRERRVTETVQTFRRWLQIGVTTYAQYAVMFRLLLVDQIRRDSSGSKALRTLTDALVEWSLGQFPAECLDLMTADGALIARLAKESRRRLRWRFVHMCQQVGFAPADVIGAAQSSRALQRLLCSEEPLSLELVALAFAVAQANSETLTYLQATTLLQRAANGSPQEFDTPSDVFVESTDRQLAIRARGLFFRHLHLTSPP
jgi:hypothetical protein